MSARANPYHNAWTKSFMGTLKTEMLGDGCISLRVSDIYSSSNGNNHCLLRVISKTADASLFELFKRLLNGI